MTTTTIPVESPLLTKGSKRLAQRATLKKLAKQLKWKVPLQRLILMLKKTVSSQSQLEALTTMLLTSRYAAHPSSITYTFPSRFVLIEPEQEPAHTFPCPFCVKKKAKAEQEPDEEKREKKLKRIKRVAWPTKGELTRHVMYHREKYTNKKDFYICQVHECDVDVFTDLEKFLGHQKSHHKLEHACMSTNCFYRFESKTDLLEHLTTHDHETPFKCRLPGCDEEFQFYSARQKHEDNHFLDIAVPEASDIESDGDPEARADGQNERSSAAEARVAK